MKQPEGPLVAVEKTAAALVVTLQRPAARNALTLDMVRSLHAALQVAAADPAICRIVFRSALPGTFCAGGDIRMVREHVMAGRMEDAMAFFREEFALNQAIADSKKPIVVLIDGICFGGGCGLALHASHPLATENAIFAMPETRIGYIPDVGSSHFLSRLPPGIGNYLALLGARFATGDAVRLGLVRGHVPSDRVDSLLDALASETADTDLIIRRFSAEIASGEIWRHKSMIEAAFASGDVQQCERNLRAAEDPWIAAALTEFLKMSPNSLRETADVLREAEGRALADCLVLELAAVARVIRHPDFVEGVRAALVDKDFAPKWHGAEN